MRGEGVVGSGLPSAISLTPSMQVTTSASPTRVAITSETLGFASPSSASAFAAPARSLAPR